MTGVQTCALPIFRNRRIFEAFGLEYNNETKKLDKRNRKEFEKIDLNDKKRRCYWTNLICKLFGSDGGKINYVMGNLAVKGLFEVTEGGDAITKPSAIRVTAKGLLLGELLHEGYCSDEYWKKNFRIYRLGYRVLQTIILIAVITIILVFLNQLWEFKDKVLSKYLQ